MGGIVQRDHPGLQRQPVAQSLTDRSNKHPDNSKLFLVPPDPTALIQLFKDTDRRIDEIVTSCQKRWVNQEARKEFQLQVHTEVNSLFVAIFNDIRQLEQELGERLWDEQTRFPTMQEMAESLPEIFRDSPQLDAREQSRRRIHWVVFQWLQLQVNLYGMLSTVPAVAETRSKHHPDESVPKYGPLEEPHLIVGTLDRLKALTLEYLRERARMLAAHGRESYGLNINWEQEPSGAMQLAWNAYYRGEPSVVPLLLNAIRFSLLNLFELRTIDRRFELTDLKTHHLVWVAIQSGIELPPGAQTLGNIIVDLEKAAARCESIDQMLLLPAIRIVNAAVEGIGVLHPTEDQLRKARSLFKGGTNQHENSSRRA